MSPEVCRSHLRPDPRISSSVPLTCNERTCGHSRGLCDNMSNLSREARDRSVLTVFRYVLQNWGRVQSYRDLQLTRKEHKAGESKEALISSSSSSGRLDKGDEVDSGELWILSTSARKTLEALLSLSDGLMMTC
jgi:hypothetical protein